MRDLFHGKRSLVNFKYLGLDQKKQAPGHELWFVRTGVGPLRNLRGKRLGLINCGGGLVCTTGNIKIHLHFFGPLSSNFVSSAIDRGGIELAVDFMPPIHRIKDVTGLGAILRTGILLGGFSPFLSLQTR